MGAGGVSHVHGGGGGGGVALSLLRVAHTALPLALPAALFVATQQLNLYAATELDAVTFQGARGAGVAA